MFRYVGRVFIHDIEDMEHMNNELIINQFVQAIIKYYCPAQIIVVRKQAKIGYHTHYSITIIAGSMSEWQGSLNKT